MAKSIDISEMRASCAALYHCDLQQFADGSMETLDELRARAVASGGFLSAGDAARLCRAQKRSKKREPSATEVAKDFFV